MSPSPVRTGCTSETESETDTRFPTAQSAGWNGPPTRLPFVPTGAESCALGQIRTADTRFRRAVLYPLSYEGGVWPHPR